MRMAAIFAAVFLAACAVVPERFTGPNGKAAYEMACRGMGRTMLDCYRKASELCPQGYAIIHQSDQDADRRTLAVECK